MPTTFVLLAIDHDPATRPNTWDWAALADHPEPVGVVASATVDDDLAGDHVAARGWAALQ